MDELKDTIKKLAKEYTPKVIGIRRHLHKHPELSFQEHETSAYVAGILKEYNLQVIEGWVKTGITATLKGKKEGKKIVLRADLDALPILEENNADYCSVNKGIMHACGHDVHTASVLGAMFILNQLKEDWNGEIQFLFQPGEEKLPGGASLMLEEGAIKVNEVSAILGQHVQPNLAVGKVGFRPGMYMASTDEIYITINGKGGHGAMPHLNIDPVSISAQVIVSLQQLVSRIAPPTVPTVLSFGKIIGNGATNVIPDKVYLEGTFRTFDENWRNLAHRKITEITHSISQSMGATAEVSIVRGYPFLVNDEVYTHRMKHAAVNYLGSENVVDLELRMTAEDFAYYSQVMPSCFYRLGTGNIEKGIISNVHTSTFDIDENALETAIGLMAYLALESLQ